MQTTIYHHRAGPQTQVSRTLPPKQWDPYNRVEIPFDAKYTNDRHRILEKASLELCRFRSGLPYCHKYWTKR